MAEVRRRQTLVPQRSAGLRQIRPPRVQPIVLTAADFIQSVNPIGAAIGDAPILTYEMPIGQAIRFGAITRRGPTDGDSIYRSRLQGRQDGSGTTTAGGVLTINLTPATLAIVESPNLPGARSIEVYTAIGAANWVRQLDAALTLTFATGVITVSGLPASTVVTWVVYGLLNDPNARVRFAIRSAGASAHVEEQIIEEVRLGDLNPADQQAGGRVSVFKGWAVAYEGDRFLVYLHSALAHAPSVVLHPGGITAGRLTQIELRGKAVAMADLIDWILGHAPDVPLDRISAALLQTQRRLPVLDPLLVGVPPVPGFLTDTA